MEAALQLRVSTPRTLLCLASLVCLALAGKARAASAIPFEYRDGLIWVKVKAEASAAPLNFLLDSGAGASVLNLATAQRLGVPWARRPGSGVWAVRCLPRKPKTSVPPSPASLSVPVLW